MKTQGCFFSQSVNYQNADISAAFQLLNGVTINPSCSLSPALDRWFIYSAISEFAEFASIEALNTIAAGTAYILTATPAALDFGTTDPVITFTQAGQYQITADIQVGFGAATFAAVQSVAFKLRRTNNTAADIGSSRYAVIPIITTTTGFGPSVRVQFLYTAAAGDVVTIFGSVSVLPSAGTITASSAQITAVPVR